MEIYMEPMPAPYTASARMAETTENGFDFTYLGKLPIAMAYVPFQRWSKLYEPCRALERGTVFPELDLPFCGRELV